MSVRKYESVLKKKKKQKSMIIRKYETVQKTPFITNHFVRVNRVQFQRQKYIFMFKCYFCEGGITSRKLLKRKENA